ncbi:GNAT family N-acetyltransferase [Natronoglycomyces albus]|uniref:GNAT family N-acetyltransferase n=1 Tax=Natronoglycomyces albus TaxID=2811108 RepID=A0A895XPJ2_9ACTN|nr:GNAT family N-acetyltransferase [Natronoglycomyces albus]
MADRTFSVTRAREDDVPTIVALLRDDVLGAGRESDDLSPYRAAFAAIDADAAQFLATVRNEDGEVVATMQLTLIPGLSRAAALRLQIEAVRVARSERGTGLGTAIFHWAIEYGRERGAKLVQLTTDAQRPDARRFYESLGFVASHVGMKLALD